MKLWLPSARRLRNWVLQVLGSFSSLLKTNHIQQRRRPPPNNTHPAGTQVLDAAIAITILLLLLLLLLRYRSCTFWRCSTLAQVVTCTAYVITIQTIIEQKRNDGRLSLVWRRRAGDGSCWYDKKKKRGAKNQSFNPHVFAAVASFLLGLWVVVFYYYCVRAHCTSCIYEKKEEEDSSSAPAVGWKKEKKILTSLKDSQREGQKTITMATEWTETLLLSFFFQLQGPLLLLLSGALYSLWPCFTSRYISFFPNCFSPWLKLCFLSGRQLANVFWQEQTTFFVPF